MIMIATAIAGEAEGMIIGYYLYPAESEEYWLRFISVIRKILLLQNIPILVIISDRDKGLQRAVETTFPQACHSYCVGHIERNIVSRFRKSCSNIWTAAKASSISDFELQIQEIAKNNGQAVAEYIRNIPCEHWARAYFKIPRFGHVTSYIAESINASLGSVLKMIPLN
ncbi:hypothetical protein ENBRE01_2197 [Enteropsectra breve]|nr:hypothetical protein ENBRE01_2197 [Enteropsectra breve]